MFGYGRFQRLCKANPIMDDFTSTHEDRNCFHTHKVTWQKDYPTYNKFSIQPNTESTDKRLSYGQYVSRKFTPKSFNYKCFDNT